MLIHICGHIFASLIICLRKEFFFVRCCPNYWFVRQFRGVAPAGINIQRLWHWLQFFPSHIMTIFFISWTHGVIGSSASVIASAVIRMKCSLYASNMNGRKWTSTVNWSMSINCCSLTHSLNEKSMETQSRPIPEKLLGLHDFVVRNIDALCMNWIRNKINTDIFLLLSLFKETKNKTTT